MQPAEHNGPVHLARLDALQRVRLALCVEEAEDARVGAHVQTAVAGVDFEAGEVARLDPALVGDRDVWWY